MTATPIYDAVKRDLPRIMADLKAAREKRAAEERETTSEPDGGEPR